jgi:hypothetical protein
MVHVAVKLFSKELSIFLSFILPNIETVFNKASVECLFRMAAILIQNYLGFKGLNSGLQNCLNFL